jgi:hypothetical protein
MTSYKEAYKYPFIATEILSSKNKLIREKLLNNNNDENYILKLLKVLDNKDILNTTIPGYIMKIISAHLDNDLFYENINKNKETIFNILLKYVYNDSYRDLFYSIFNEAMNKGKNEFDDFIPKLFDYLLINMNNYILKDNKDDLVELKDGITNIIYIFIKLAENKEEIFNLIINKFIEYELIRKLKENLKEIDETDRTNQNNINILFCINSIIILITNLLNIIITKKENDVYAFNKYYLSTIFDPPYSLNNYITYNINDNNRKEITDKDIKEKNENKDVEMKVEEEDKKENINLSQLNDIGLAYLNEVYTFFDKYIKVINNLNKSVIFSLYDKTTDLIILFLIINSSEENEKLKNFLDQILISLIKLIIEYPQYNIINNKILQIFKLISQKNISISKSLLITYLKEFLFEQKLNDLISNEGVITNNSNENSNNIYLINILNILEKQENEKVCKYLQKTNEGLLENEKMEVGDYVPKMEEDEIIFEKKQDIHDTEGFIFTPKKVIEDSKKIMKNLKEFDV